MQTLCSRTKRSQCFITLSIRCLLADSMLADEAFPVFYHSFHQKPACRLYARGRSVPSVLSLFPSEACLQTLCSRTKRSQCFITLSIRSLLAYSMLVDKACCITLSKQRSKFVWKNGTFGSLGIVLEKKDFWQRCMRFFWRGIPHKASSQHVKKRAVSRQHIPSVTFRLQKISASEVQNLSYIQFCIIETVGKCRLRR